MQAPARRASLPAPLRCRVGTRVALLIGVRVALGIALGGVLPAVAAEPAARDLPSQSFGDWLAACDNGGDCTAYGFGTGDNPATLILSRPRGGAPAITLIVQPDGARPSSLRLQEARHGPAVTIRLSSSGPGTLRGTLSAGEVAALLPVLGSGGRLVLSRLPARPGGRPAPLGAIRLAGVAAALDWIAERQRRALDPLPALRPSPPSDGPQPDPRHLPAAVASMAAVRACRRQDAGDGPGTDDAAWRLDRSFTLWSIPCGSGNFDRQTLFVLAGAHGSAALASFTALAQMSPHPPGVLVNAETGADGRDISATAPSRGLGDCGDFRNYRWDGSRYRLVLARLMTACRGLSVEDWPVVYRGRR
jgi:hypothetical protein